MLFDGRVLWADSMLDEDILRQESSGEIISIPVPRYPSNKTRHETEPKNHHQPPPAQPPQIVVNECALETVVVEVGESPEEILSAVDAILSQESTTESHQQQRARDLLQEVVLMTIGDHLVLDSDANNNPIF